MITCKNCHHTHTVKNGLVRGKQRDQCRACGDNFVLGDERHSHATAVKNAFCMIVYSLGNASFGFVATRLGVSRTTTYDWIRPAAAGTDEPTSAPAMQDIECAELWHLMQSTKARSGL